MISPKDWKPYIRPGFYVSVNPYLRDACQVGKAVKVGPNWDGRPMYCYCTKCERKRDMKLDPSSKVLDSVREYGLDRYDLGYKMGWNSRDSQANSNFTAGCEAGRLEYQKQIVDLKTELSVTQEACMRRDAILKERDKTIEAQAKRIIALEKGSWTFLEEYGIKHIKGDLLLDEPPKLSIVLSCGSTLELHPRGR